jgi:hypothetical protein
MSDAATRLQVRDVRHRLSQLRIPELRTILMNLNLARSGRKSELVERVAIEIEVSRAPVSLPLPLLPTLTDLCLFLMQNFADRARGTTSAAFYAERLSATLRIVEEQLRGRGSYVSPTPQGAQTAYRNGNVSPQLGGRYAPIAPTTPPARSMPTYGRNATPYGAVNVAPSGTGVIPLTSGVDLYNPTKAAALDGARCFCVTQALSGKVVKCVDCGLVVHAKCHQLITVSNADE